MNNCKKCTSCNCGQSNEKRLSEFKIGERGVVKKVLGDGRVRRRLFDMGVTPTANITLKKKAPFGDPFELSVRGYDLTVRKQEAELVIMEVEND